MVLRKISDIIKETLDTFEEDKMYDNMKKHYQTLRLIDENGDWALPELEKLSNGLLPQDITSAKSKDFVDNVFEYLKDNECLMNFLEKAKDRDFKQLRSKVENEGHIVFPDAIAYALVLEKLTKAIYNDYTIAERLLTFFKDKRQKCNASKYTDLFLKLKLASVEYPIRNIFVESRKTKILHPSAGRWILSINILEALIADIVLGMFSNAMAAIALVFNRPGKLSKDIRTGEGPTCWADDNKGFSINVPLPKEWNDLYQSWNMAFITNSGEYPLSITKLLIPQVSNYKDNPSGYMVKRAIALFLLVNHSTFKCVDKISNNIPFYDWGDSELTKLWGECNLQSSRDYKRKLAEKRSQKIPLVEEKGGELNKIPSYSSDKGKNQPLEETLCTVKSVDKNKFSEQAALLRSKMLSSSKEANVHNIALQIEP